MIRFPRRDQSATSSLFENAFVAAPAGAALARVGGTIIEGNSRLLELLERSRDEMVGSMFIDHVHARERAEFDQLWHEIVLGRLDRFTGRVRFVRRDGASIGLMASVSLARDRRGRAETVQVYVVDLSDELQVERDLRRREAELERALRQVKATTALAGSLSGESELGQILTVVARRSKTLVQASSLAVLLPEDGHMVVAAVAGESADRWRGVRVPRDAPPIATALASQNPEHLAGLPDVQPLARAGLSPCSAALVVRFTWDQGVVGLLVAVDRIVAGPAFSPEDERLLRAYAVTAGSAISTARSLQDERARRSVESSELERSRIAGDLHDDVLQRLAGLRVSLSWALSSNDDPTLRTAVDDALTQLASIIGGIRALIFELRPAVLDQLGLVAALEGLVEQKSERVGVDIRLEARLGGAEPLSPDLDNAVYRIAQEALTNAEKHARPTHVSVTVAVEEAFIELTVADDGQGFAQDAPNSRGFGLVGMADRAAAVGGELRVHSRPGEGTRVQARLPRFPLSRLLADSDRS